MGKYVLDQDDIDDLVENDDWKESFSFKKVKGKHKMTEVLSAKEIDELLKAINAGETDPEDLKPACNARKIKIYDFKRPDKFSKEQIRTVSIMHETFARLSTTFLSARLRQLVHVHVASVDQLTYEEFIRSVPTPTTMAIINMDPLKGSAILEIDPAVTFAFIDRLCGGTGEGTKSQHELTDIEMSLMEGMIVRLLGNIREAWSQIIDLRPRLGQVDTNPQFCMIVPPTEMTVLVTFEVKVGDVEGMFNLCIPHILLEPIMDRMSAAYWYGSGWNNTVPKTFNQEKLDNIDVSLRAEYFKTTMSLSQLSYLLNNNGIILNEDHEENTGKLYINNLYIGEFKEIDVLREHKKIKITKITNIMEKNYMNEKNNIDFSGGNLSEIKVQIITELGRTSRTLKEISSFGEGTILELDKLAGEPVDIFANNVLIAKGEVVVIDENFGVRITDVLNQKEKEEGPCKGDEAQNS